MKKYIALMLAFAWMALIPLEVTAAEFQWFTSFNIEAQQDLARFNKALQDRFDLAGDKIQDIIDRTASAADAYMSLRLGEMSRKPVDEVLKKYKSGKQNGKGWGALAKSLGIKPGSQEFHALKQGHDLYSKNDAGKCNGNGKGKGNSKGKGKKK